MTAKFLHPVFAVPCGQRLDILAYRMVEPCEVRAEHIHHVVLQHTLPRVCRHLTTDRTDYALVEKPKSLTPSPSPRGEGSS